MCLSCMCDEFYSQAPSPRHNSSARGLRIAAEDMFKAQKFDDAAW